MDFNVDPLMTGTNGPADVANMDLGLQDNTATNNDAKAGDSLSNLNADSLFDLEDMSYDLGAGDNNNFNESFFADGDDMETERFDDAFFGLNSL